jgi:hypothetical protein
MFISKARVWAAVAVMAVLAVQALDDWQLHQ